MLNLAGRVFFGNIHAADWIAMYLCYRLSFRWRNIARGCVNLHNILHWWLIIFRTRIRSSRC